MFVTAYSKIIKINMQKRIPFLDNFNRYRFSFSEKTIVFKNDPLVLNF